MRRRPVVLTPEATDDLVGIYEWILDAAGPQTAIGFIERLEAYCAGLDLASERGRLRDEIRTGLRVVGFERKVTIAFTVNDDRVAVLRLFYRGRDWEADWR